MWQIAAIPLLGGNRMGLRSIVLLAVAAVAVFVLKPSLKPAWWGKDGVVTIASADSRLVAAKARAAATLDTFLAAALGPRPGTSKHAVKIALRDDDATEVFWVKDLKRGADGRFTGRLDNKPTLVKTVKEGQSLSFGRGDIVDWVYMENGRMVGNHTICVLLDETTEPKLSEVKARFGVDCSWQATTVAARPAG
jgi:uncharacterized protein YegJ (DUF2314 family)